MSGRDDNLELDGALVRGLTQPRLSRTQFLRSAGTLTASPPSSATWASSPERSSTLFTAIRLEAPRNDATNSVDGRS